MQPMLESLFNKVRGPRHAILLKRDSNTRRLYSNDTATHFIHCTDINYHENT